MQNLDEWVIVGFARNNHGARIVASAAHCRSLSKIQTATNFGWVVALIAMFIQKRKNFPFKTHGVSLRRHVFSTKASAMQRKMVRYRTFILPPMT